MLGSFALLLSACSTLDYYAHMAKGQFELLRSRQPIARLIADPATDDQLKAKLKLALEARAFASDTLGLPRNGSYTSYADLGRPWVLQNLFATPEFSLDAVEHCFPIAGCVAYRGYYDEVRLKAEAERLKAQGYEVYIGQVPAYSTLGWFDDPVLNTMLPRDDRKDDDDLAGTVFHELAHQQLYLQGDTRFNESFASFVEQQGLRQWRAARHQAADSSDRRERADQFAALILATRERLQKLYTSGIAEAEMRSAKQAEFERLRADYRQLRDGPWQGYAGYDGWIDGELNNAKLLPFGLYHQWLPGFAKLFEEAGGDWPRFYAAAKKLADGEPAQRAATLEVPDPEIPDPSATP
ncbi:MAG: aminopeptidase [Nevskia sp.]|nr:aminopeptidase [Nevskia sp.]